MTNVSFGTMTTLGRTNNSTYVQVAGLVICLGALYGLGAGMIYGPAMHYLGHWFVKRKSLAYGIM